MKRLTENSNTKNLTALGYVSLSSWPKLGALVMSGLAPRFGQVWPPPDGVKVRLFIYKRNVHRKNESSFLNRGREIALPPKRFRRTERQTD